VVLAVLAAGLSAFPAQAFGNWTATVTFLRTGGVTGVTLGNDGILRAEWGSYQAPRETIAGLSASEP